MPRRLRVPAPSVPTVPELVVAPELAALSLLDHALDLARAALLAEHMTLIDELRRPGEHGPAVDLAHTICLRAASLRRVLARYARAARDAPRPAAMDSEADLPF
jgi:hypothetical protein